MSTTQENIPRIIIINIYFGFALSFIVEYSSI